MAILRTMGVSSLLVVLASVAVSFLHSSGHIEFSMPYPAVNHKVITILPQHVPSANPGLKGVFASNTLLWNATKLFDEKLHGAESIAVTPDGHLAFPDKWGVVWSAQPPSTDPSASDTAHQYQLSEYPWARTGLGRPLGAHYDAEGNLVICDSIKGLIKVDKDTRAISLLAVVVSDDSPLEAGTNIHYANDLDIAKDGRIFFSSSQDILPKLARDWHWDTFGSYKLGIFSGQARGRLLVHDPASRKTHVLTNDLFYANGVALSSDESFVAVVETSSNRVWRYWLEGPKAGTREIFVDALPGFPDGISRASDGGFWLALVAPVPSIRKLYWITPLRAMLSWLPSFLHPSAAPWGCVVKLSPEGQVQYTFQDPDGTFIAGVSSATEHAGKLWLGNLHHKYVAYVELDKGLRALPSKRVKASY